MNLTITDDQTYAIEVTPRADPGQCHVDFRMWELGGMEMSQVPKPIDTQGGYFDPEKSPVYCHGTVKWDGCVNFDFDDDGVMLHFCSIVGPGGSFDEFRNAFAKTYQLAAAEMGDKWLDCIDDLGGSK